jgi:transmembrane sensor
MKDLPHLAAAWDWVLRLRDDNASQEDLTAWLEWYEADERHKQAFEEMQALWRGASRLVEGPRALSIEELLNGPMPAARRPSKDARRFGARSMALAATVLLAACAGLVYYLKERTGDAIVAAASPTIAREARLPDGTTVELASRSAISVQYTPEQRVLEMKAGEVYFAVARQSERPFIVKVGDLRVQAVGTAFNVRRSDRRIVVTVTEGKVKVEGVEFAGAESASATSVLLTAGHQLTWSEDQKTPTIAAVEADRALTWRKGRLEYLNEPLSAVVADINRYAAHPARLSDEAAGEILFTGAVLTNATEDWLRALPDVFPVRVDTGRDGTIEISSRR